MSAWTNLFCVLGLLFVFTRGTDAINCYVCNLSGCGDEFSSTASGVTESNSCDKCSKVKAEDVVNRGCAHSSIADGCTDTEVLEVKVTTCVCSTDLCNSADHATISVMTSLVLGLCTLLAKRMF